MEIDFLDKVAAKLDKITDEEEDLSSNSLKPLARRPTIRTTGKACRWLRLAICHSVTAAKTRIAQSRPEDWNHSLLDR